jgi:hypothetical protein
MPVWSEVWRVADWHREELARLINQMFLDPIISTVDPPAWRLLD